MNHCKHGSSHGHCGKCLDEAHNLAAARFRALSPEEQRERLARVGALDPVPDAAEHPFLVPRLTEAEAELERWLAVIPKCSWGCGKLGTKWISRHVVNCDEHGSEFLQDVPWAALARERNAR